MEIMFLGFAAIVITLLLFKINKLNKEKKDTKRYNIEIEQANAALQTLNFSLLSEKTNIENLISEKKIQVQQLELQVDTTATLLSEKIERQKELSAHAFEKYFDTLEKQYEKVDEEYDEKVQDLQTQLELEQKTLKEMQDARAAVIERLRQEKEREANLDFYRVKVNKTELNDIKALEDVKCRLAKPRVLSMLIWQTFYQKPLTSLCASVVGTKAVCGIYKITNQLDQCSYIGQSVDISQRWKDHAKCMLGIDAPAGNKLYAAAAKDGLHNFTFEIIEECERQKLNDRESYWINFYKSYDLGYNSTKGNK